MYENFRRRDVCGSFLKMPCGYVLQRPEKYVHDQRHVCICPYYVMNMHFGVNGEFIMKN